jgi:hypothetical protein
MDSCLHRMTECFRSIMLNLIQHDAKNEGVLGFRISLKRPYEEK